MKKDKPDIETFAAKIADKQDNPSMRELVKTFPEKTYNELEKYKNADRHAEANQIPLTEAQRNLVDHIESAVEKSKSRIGTCIPAQMRKDRTPLDQMKGKVKEAQDALANALEVNESHHRLNGKLQEKVTELEEEGMKLHKHVERQVTGARKAGM